ncbi:sucrase/ferredoxin-like domain-containing protein [Hirsutella rhossiliensis]|uniref:Sucrase/ferredoxin-like domain-containing protein n=1 Tax=Hirsutella rhossiliensis TaxID=111463 RepID=A0A9P8MPC5_9HYPO|nr:sucrase/ferredoxin-like domain-containing protein [Hirsutella rhossiliensis]KAH0958755.1 sucrase/ferredoxin-like domain-containing protein [Hirsutella rhossiliensis]
MAVSLKSLMSSVLGSQRSNGTTPGRGPPAVTELFSKTDPAADGDECLHDCDGCTVRYPRGFSVDVDDRLYGQIKAWSTHLLVGTGKTDWVRDVTHEKGSVMEAVEKADAPSNGRLMLSASNMPTPHDTSDYSEPTTVLLLPAFTLVHNVHPLNVPTLLGDLVDKAPTSISPLDFAALPRSLPSRDPSIPALTTAPCPHSAVILMCSQRTRDARCGQSAPLLRKEFERHLRPLGLYRDLHDERPGGVGIYFISHVGGHKYSANVMVYRRPNAFGQDEGDSKEPVGGGEAANGHGETDQGAAQCIWLARVRPEDCENLVRYTVLKGKVVKPESQLRGGFDRVKGLTSW